MWVDAPSEGISIAFTSETHVYSSTTLEELTDHPLAGLDLARIAVSRDGMTAVGVDHLGGLRVIDAATGSAGPSFDSIEVGNVAAPVVVSDDGRVAITIEQDGTVTMWHLPSRAAAIRFESEAGRPLTEAERAEGGFPPGPGACG